MLHEGSTVLCGGGKFADSEQEQQFKDAVDPS